MITITAPLTHILTELVERAREGAPAEFTLSRGLRIELKYYPVTNSYRLTLSRLDTEPSWDEWQAVILHWPYRVRSTPVRHERSLTGIVPGWVQMRLM